MNNILAKVFDVKSSVVADGNVTSVTVELTMPPLWVDLNGEGYIEKKYKKLVPALKCIGVSHNMDTHQQVITIIMEINGKFNSVDDINTLENMGKHIAYLTKERLSEEAVLKNIGMDCKPWINEEATNKDA